MTYFIHYQVHWLHTNSRDTGCNRIQTFDSDGAHRAFDEWFRVAFAGKAEYRLLAINQTAALAPPITGATGCDDQLPHTTTH